MVEQKKITLSASIREVVGKKVKLLRSQGILPATIYGRNSKPENLSIALSDFVKVFAEAGTAALVDLKIDGANSIKVLMHEPDLDPVRETPIHVDFYRVRMDEKIKTEIPLEFIGSSDAVENMDGSLVTNRDNVEVECLPADLVPHIEVDISALKTFEDQITVADLKVPAGIEILTDGEEVISLVEEPRSEEELEALDESAAEEEKEAIEQVAGAEGEEGEQASDDAKDKGEAAPEPQEEESK